MSITLPTTPGIRSAVPSLISYGGLLSPSLGGAVQRLNRLGDRHALKITLPPMRSEPDGRIYASKLRRALQEGAIFSWPQDQFTVGTVGTPLVNGAGQTGTTLVLDGFAASYAVREGQFFSILHGGRHYLHSAAAATGANGTGQISLPIFPMLRISPADNAVCEFAAPKIEGWLTGGQVDWSLMLEPWIQIPDFTITEAE